jgi:hypothetical protein
VSSVPATIENAQQFEGWEAILELNKQRCTDKPKQKRFHQSGVIEKSGK